eukprot:6214227-Pleurochrysis_carterae.AAC.1
MLAVKLEGPVLAPIAEQSHSPVGDGGLPSICRGCRPPFLVCDKVSRGVRWSYLGPECGKEHDGRRHNLRPPMHTRCPHTLHGCIRDHSGRAGQSCCMSEASIEGAPLPCTFWPCPCGRAPQCLKARGLACRV